MRELTTPQVFISGRPLQSMVLWGDLHIIDRWPYGCWEMRWNVILKPYQRVPALLPGALVEARMASGLRWAGLLGMPDWDSGQMIATGLVRQGETALAFDGSLNTTSVPDTAIDQAISRGAVQWVRRTSLSATALAASGSTANLNYLTPLLDAWALSANKRWGVSGQREVYAAADPTIPSFAVRPGAGELGQSAANLAGKIFGRYIDLSGNYVTTSIGSGTPEVGVGLMAYGPISSAQATGILQGFQTAIQPKAGWTAGIPVTKDLVTSLGGQRYPLELVKAGLMARLVGLRDDRGRVAAATGMTYTTNPVTGAGGGLPAATDIVIGESDWDVSGGTVGITPVGLDDPTLSGAVEDIGGELLS